MILHELLEDQHRRDFAAAPEADALFDIDALQEAALLEVRYNMVTSSVWLLFDCRGALQIEMGNTAAVVVRDVHVLRWEGTSLGPRTWRAVLGWTPRIVSGDLSLVVELSPGGRLEIEGKAGEFYVGNIPGSDDPPPNFMTASDSEIRAGLAQWGSDFDPVHASFLEPDPNQQVQ